MNETGQRGKLLILNTSKSRKGGFGVLHNDSFIILYFTFVSTSTEKSLLYGLAALYMHCICTAVVSDMLFQMLFLK